jgi:hypothetical protein
MMRIRVPGMTLISRAILVVVSPFPSPDGLARPSQRRAAVKRSPVCRGQAILKLAMWCVPMVTALLLGCLLIPAVASANKTDKGPIGKMLFIQYPRDATGEIDRASGDFSIGGTGVLCSDYSYSGIHWANPNGIEYWINTAGSGVPASTAVSSVRAAFDTWDSACGPLSFSYQGATSLGAGSEDSKNVVSWGDVSDHPGAIAVTYYWYNIHSNEIIEADTRMSISLAWSYTAPNVTHDLSGVATEDASRYDDPTNSGVTGKYDIQNIMTHEAGHWLNLHDLYGGTQSELTMYGYGATGELKKDTLAYGDELGVESVYQIQVTINTSGLVSSYPASVHYWQGGVAKTATTYGTWSSAVDDGSAVSIDSEVAVSSTERYSTMAETSWNAIQSATYTVPYYHQYKPDISAVTAGPGHTDLNGTNCATLTYTRFGAIGTYSIFDGQSFNDWVDTGSTTSLSNPSSGSTTDHRWYASGTASWTVNDASVRSATYWDQIRPTITVATAGTGHTDLDGTNYATLTHTRFGAAGTSSIFDAQSFSDWIDIGSVASLPNHSSASTSTHRWYSSETTSWTVSDAGSYLATYWDQLKPTISVVTAGNGHTDLDSTNCATLTYSRFSNAGTASVFDAQSFNDWVDIGSTASLSNPSSASASTHRWYNPETTSWVVDDATSWSATYSEQFEVGIAGITGLASLHPITITFTRNGATNSLSASDTWTDWADIGSTLSVTKSVEGGWIGDWSTKDTTDWAVDSPISASIRYHRSYVGLYVLIGGLLVAATIIGVVIFFLLRIRRKGHSLRDLPDYLSDHLGM